MDTMLLGPIPHVRVAGNRDAQGYQDIDEFVLMDADADGHLDLVTGRYEAYDDIQVYFGPINPFSCDIAPADGTFVQRSSRVQPSLVPAGDVTGDGVDDLIMSDHLIPGPLPTPMNFFDGFPSYGEGVLLPAGDRNQDGVADLLWFAGALGEEESVELLFGPPSPEDVGEPFLTIGDGAWFHPPVVVGDLNGDGLPDYAAEGNLERPPSPIVWVVTELPSAPAPIEDAALLLRPTTSKWGIDQGVGPAGDLNGDGYQDLFVEHGWAKVFFGPFDAHGTADLDAPQFTAGTEGPPVLEARGDVDGDGFDDISIAALWYGDSLCPKGDERLCSPGAIHLIAGPREGMLDEADTLEGDLDYGAIGWHTVGDLDIDGDGTKDLAVTNGPMLYLIFGV